MFYYDLWYIQQELSVVRNWLTGWIIHATKNENSCKDSTSAAEPKVLINSKKKIISVLCNRFCTIPTQSSNLFVFHLLPACSIFKIHWIVFSILKQFFFHNLTILIINVSNFRHYWLRATNLFYLCWISFFNEFYNAIR